MYKRQDLYDLIEGAVGVFSSSSTTAIESLMSRKHIIVFGSEPYIFGSNILAPIHRVTNLEILPNVIKDCISKPVDKDKINAYLFSLFSSSSSVKKSDDNTVYTSFQNADKQIEYAHIVKMISKTIQ